MKEEIKVKTSDQVEIIATLYKVECAKKLIIINSALGVKQGFYEQFGMFISKKGYSVLTWDGRGIGKSVNEMPSKDKSRMSDWGKLDFDAILNYSNQELKYSWDDIIVIGHSAGGHLAGLSESFKNINHFCLISSGTCSWHLYSSKVIPKMMLLWHVVVPLVLRIYNYIPAKFGLGHDIPRGIIEDWRKWSLSRNYLFSDQELDLNSYEKYAGTIFSIGFSDDEEHSPEKTTLDLLKYFPNANKKHQSLHPSDLGQRSIGHFSLFKKNSVWEEIVPLLGL